MKHLKNKNYGVFILIGILIIGAIYLNIKLNKSANNNGASNSGYTQTAAPNAQKDDDSVTTGVNAAGSDYFAAFRQERDSTRKKEVEYLEQIIASAATDKETLKDAQEQKMAIVDDMESEFTMESLIKAKGFNDVAVTFHKGSVNVIVDSEQLSQEQVAQILDIVQKETGEAASNIKVSAKQ